MKIILLTYIWLRIHKVDRKWKRFSFVTWEKAGADSTLFFCINMMSSEGPYIVFQKNHTVEFTWAVTLASPLKMGIIFRCTSSVECIVFRGEWAHFLWWRSCHHSREHPSADSELTLTTYASPLLCQLATMLYFMTTAMPTSPVLRNQDFSERWPHDRHVDGSVFYELGVNWI